MGLRELLILLLGFAIVAVILRGLYVAMQARRGQIKLAIDKNIPKDVDLDALEMAELPGGGARVVSRAPEASEPSRPNALDAAKARAAALDLGEEDDAIPVLMDSVAVADAAQQQDVDDDYMDDDYADDGEIGAESDFEEESSVNLGSEDWQDPDEVLLDYEDEVGTARPAASNNLDSVRPDDRDEDNEADEPFAEQQGEFAFTDEPAISDDNFEDEDYTDEDEQAATAYSDDDEAYNDYADDDEDDFEEDLADDDYSEEEMMPQGEARSTGYQAYDDYEDQEQEEYDDPEAYDEEYEEGYEDEAVDAAPEPARPAANERVEPRFDPNAALDDEPFSMTAGERIGYQEKAAPAGRSLFSRFSGNPANEEKPQAQPEAAAETAEEAHNEDVPSRRTSLFASISRKVLEQSRERFSSRDSDVAENEVESEIEEQFEDTADVATQSAPAESEQREAFQAPEQPQSERYTEAPPAKTAVTAEIRPATSGQPTEIRQQTAATQPSEVIVLNVMARDGYVFYGDDLMPCLLTSGLKFGEMAIFHQRFGNDNRGPVIFSVANILNPGTFDLNDMANFTTVGISMFLALPSPINNLEAFDMMLGTARQLCTALDGELRDDHRNVMTAQTIEHYRQRIRDFELRQLKAAGSRG